MTSLQLERDAAVARVHFNHGAAALIEGKIDLASARRRMQAARHGSATNLPCGTTFADMSGSHTLPGHRVAPAAGDLRSRLRESRGRADLSQESQLSVGAGIESR